MRPPPVVELRRAAKRFGTVHALMATDLTADAGRTTVLIGPSGCGKSTVLRLMLGLIKPDDGQVLFDGVPYNRENTQALRRRMGYVIQDGGLFPHLTARNNVLLPAKYFGWKAERIRARLAELRGLTRFPADALDRYPVELSGGQRQRVAIMRALMLDADALFLDEPLGALDPMVRAELQKDLREIFRGLGKTVVLVTHDLAEAAFFADVIVLMSNGRVVQASYAGLGELARAPAEPFVTQFLDAQRTVLALEQRSP